MIIDCVSDLHGHYPKLKGGDLLIIGGDFTAGDTEREHILFCHWLSMLPYKKKIIVAGNHDNEWLKQDPCKVHDSIINPKYEYYEYLCDSGTEYQGLKIWGSPWTRSFEGQNPHCMAFTLATEEDLAKKWELIPEDTDILITHSPCFGVFDQTIRGEHVGSKSLSAWDNKAKSLLLHVCGHVHEGYGHLRVGFPTGQECDYDYITFVNASHVNASYEPVNKPIRIIL